MASNRSGYDPERHGPRRVVGKGFHARVHAVVRAIPKGRVASYGDVAAALGLRSAARQVGYALAALPHEAQDVPWHRVVNARGELARRGDGEPSDEQRERLLAEGVDVDARGRVADFVRRRARLRALPALLAALVLLFAPAVARAQPAPDAARARPNIVFVLSDDHACAAISAYGSRVNTTPQIDRLARDGVLFRNSFCANPICAPSRATILTGAHAHETGVLTNRPADAFDGRLPTFPELLADAGYQTALFGKWHLGDRPQGFETYEILPGQGNYWNPDVLTSDAPGRRVRREGHATEVVTERALRWLDDERDDGRPFLLMVQHKAPHRPWLPDLAHLGEREDEWIPEPDTLFFDQAGMAPGARMQRMTIAHDLLPLYDLLLDGVPREGDWGFTERARMDDVQGAAYDALVARRSAAFAAADPQGDERTRLFYQHYMHDSLACVAGVDDSVGRLLDALDARGLSANTIVVYASDQGFFLGERGFFDKRWSYEPSLRTPLLLRWPDVVAPGLRVDALVQNLDWAPTLLEAAGVDVPPSVQGRSLLPLLAGDVPDDWRTSLYARYVEYPDAHAVVPQMAVRTTTHTLVLYPEQDALELFDLRADPDQVVNLAHDPGARDVLAGLLVELERLRAEAGDDEAPAVDVAHWLAVAAQDASEAGATQETSAGTLSTRPPNVLLVLCDDLGYGDLGCYGSSSVPTPNLDALAADGVRLTSYTAAQPVCSASRAALLTGCYPTRLGIQGALGPGSRVGLASGETTLAELLKARGYATACFGKWHLGHLPPFLPTHHGFDRYVGIPYSNDMSPDPANNPRASARGYPPLPLVVDDEVVELEPDQSTFTERFTREAEDFIRAHRDEPFFVYLAHPMPHVPLHPGAAFAGQSGFGTYGDVIAELDASVGRLRALLDELDLTRDTYVVFTSDNGPWRVFGNHAGSVGPLRGSKGNVFEGGLRVPFLISRPGTLPGGRVLDEPVCGIDVLPTLAGLTGAGRPARRIDGRDVGPLLRGELPDDADAPDATYGYWYAGEQLQALRAGRWKLVFPHTYRSPGSPGRDGMPGEYSWPTTGLSLYDLVDDLAETTDVKDARPDVLQRLQGRAESLRVELGDSLEQREGRARRRPGRVDG
ncbi:MAG: sulfatase-like hydrolase/transferase [Planctomycetes bacterium]|nr:sulfatase-like hydrolase/transferase [Planctomycetota bacterium]